MQIYDADINRKLVVNYLRMINDMFQQKTSFSLKIQAYHTNYHHQFKRREQRVYFPYPLDSWPGDQRRKSGGNTPRSRQRARSGTDLRRPRLLTTAAALCKAVRTPITTCSTVIGDSELVRKHKLNVGTYLSNSHGLSGQREKNVPT